MRRKLWKVLMNQLECVFFFFQAEDGIRDLVRSRGLGDVYKRQFFTCEATIEAGAEDLVPAFEAACLATRPEWFPVD